MTRRARPDGIPHIDDDWLMDALTKPARAPTKRKKPSKSKLPSATFDWQDPDRLIDTVESNVRDLKAALKGDTPPQKAQTHTPAAMVIPAVALQETIQKNGRAVPLAPGIAACFSWTTNLVASGMLFAALAAHDIEPCDLLPEPLHTNICGFTPR